MSTSPRPAPAAFAVLAAASFLLGALCACGTEPSRPELTGLQPASGHPGTEVLLKGKDLDQVDDVRCQGRILDRERLAFLGTTGLRVRLPEDIQGTVILAVANKAGAAELPFAVLPSRTEVLPEALLLETGAHGPLLDFPASRRVADPAGRRHPQAPLLEAEASNAPVLVPATLNLQLPEAFFEALPQGLLAKAREWGIPDHEIEILCVSQGIGAVPHPGAVLRFQPRLWATSPADPQAPSFIHAALFDADGPVRFQSGGRDHRETRISAGSGAPLPAVVGVTPHASLAFWSLTYETGRAAATLHVLLDAPAQQALDTLATQPGTLGAFLRNLRENPMLAASRSLKHLQALFRPIADGPARVDETAGSKQAAFYHNGSGFAGARKVTLDGKPVPSFTVLSDGLLQVKAPKGSKGNLVVTTDYGDSAPFPLRPEGTPPPREPEEESPRPRRTSSH